MCIIICLTFICYETYMVSNKTANATTKDEMLLFINELGYDVLSDKPIEKSVTIPESFSGVYCKYNNLQKSAGFDLSLYKGCEVHIFTYAIKPPYDDYSGDCVINLIVYKNRVIGGDVSSAALNGFMLPLIQEKM